MEVSHSAHRLQVKNPGSGRGCPVITMMMTLAGGFGPKPGLTPLGVEDTSRARNSSSALPLLLVVSF